MSSGRPASSVCCRAVPLIVHGAWLAALIGPPPVLELPGALSCEGLALSFSGLRASRHSGSLPASPSLAEFPHGLVAPSARRGWPQPLRIARLRRRRCSNTWPLAQARRSSSAGLQIASSCSALLRAVPPGSAVSERPRQAQLPFRAASLRVSSPLPCSRSASSQSWWEVNPTGRLPAFRIRPRPASMRRAVGTCSPTALPASRGRVPTCFEAACLTLGPLMPLAALHGTPRACSPPGLTSGAKAPRALRARLLA